MTTRERPLSPHLQIYKPQTTSILSIVHRISGVFLSLGAFIIALWLVGAAYGADTFAGINAFLGSWFGKILLFFWSLAFFYHLCNGIRHLLWDAGHGLENDAIDLSGKVVVAVALVLTLLAWLLA